MRRWVAGWEFGWVDAEGRADAQQAQRASVPACPWSACSHTKLPSFAAIHLAPLCPFTAARPPSPPPPSSPWPSCPQVRHYYYRLIKRLNKILGPGSALDIKNPLQVHRSMIKFWEVVSLGLGNRNRNRRQKALPVAPLTQSLLPLLMPVNG